jgi:heme-degrading monooxygenase HmoA
MTGPYTVGIWTAKPGQADAFIDAWSEFADWTKATVPGTSWATLLRDKEDPNRFVSVGPWESLEAIDTWRANQGWTERVGRIKELVDFQTMTLDVAVEIR